MTFTDKLNNLLKIYGIEKEYNEEQVELLVSQAFSLIDRDFTEDSVKRELLPEFTGTVHTTDYYPIKKDENLCIKLNDKEIEPFTVSKNGIIYFSKKISGKLDITYTVGLDESDMEKYILPMILELVKNANGLNYSSIHEGDISISKNEDTVMKLDSLVQNIRNRYGARIKLM